MQLSQHAISRAQQRGIKYVHIILCLEYGVSHWVHGAYRYTLRHKDLPRDILRKHDKAVGTTVVMSNDSTILTVYRNRSKNNTFSSEFWSAA